MCSGDGYCATLPIHYVGVYGYVLYVGGHHVTLQAMDYDELYRVLTTVSPRTKLFKTVKRAMVKRGHWKKLPSGAYKAYGVVGSKLK